MVERLLRIRHKLVYGAFWSSTSSVSSICKLQSGVKSGDRADRVNGRERRPRLEQRFYAGEMASSGPLLNTDLFLFSYVMTVMPWYN